MKKTTLILIGVLLSLGVYAQAPQGFNYQAVVRNDQGAPLSGQQVSIRISLQDEAGVITHYSETHSVTTSPQGLASFVVGSGTVQNGTFADIPWAEGNIYMKIEVDPTGGNGYTTLGVSQLQSVPYALHAQTANRFEAIPGAGDEALFEVRNSEGKVVFAVYEQGVRIFVDGDPADEDKGNRSGFAIGGLTGLKDTGEEYFRVSRGYTQVMFDDEGKSNRSGFAIGGLTGLKADEEGKDYLSVSRERTRVLFDDAGKSNRSGFAIGGLTGLKGKEGNDGYMSITPENYLIGLEAGSSLTTGLYNSFMGYQAGKGTTEGGQNTFIGYQTGYSNTSGVRNVFVGTESGYSNTTGVNNTFMGTEAGRSNTTGSSNIFLGNKSGYENEEGIQNVFLGNQAGYSNKASNNVFLGTESGYSNTTGTNNTFMGNQAGRSNTTGGSNIFLGYRAGYANSTSSNNVFIGNESGSSNTVGTNNSFIGNNTGKANTSGTSNVFIGNYSGQANTTGNSNVMIGDRAGYGNITGYNNIILGQVAGYSGTNLQYNIMIGDSTGFYQTSQFGTKNVFIGYAAGKNNQSYNNIFIGSQAGYSNTSGQNIIAIGEKAGYMNTGSQNIFIGTSAGENNTTGFGNLIIGRYAGKYNTTASQQVILGYGAGTKLTTGGENVIIGSNAGAVNTVGIGNVYIGASAGWSNTGSYNIILGYKVGYAAFENVSNRLIIDRGYNATPLVWGEFDTRRFAINAIDPTQTLDVNGTARIRTVNSGAYSAPLNRMADGTLTTATSDVRLKTDIATLDNALNKVLQLRGVSFKWKDNPDMGNRIGFIAQEMEPVLPELVFINEADGYKGVNYAEVTAVLVEAVKEQQKMIEELKAEIEQLKKNQAK